MAKKSTRESSKINKQQPFFQDFETNSNQGESYDLKSNLFRERLFTVQTYALSLLKDMSVKMNSLDISELFWITKCEEFLHDKQYITKRQLEVLKQINDRHKVHSI